MTEEDLAVKTKELEGQWAFLSNRTYDRKVFIKNETLFQLDTGAIRDTFRPFPFTRTTVSSEDIRDLKAAEPTISEKLLSDHFFPKVEVKITCTKDIHDKKLNDFKTSNSLNLRINKRLICSDCQAVLSDLQGPTAHI